MQISEQLVFERLGRRDMEVVVLAQRLAALTQELSDAKADLAEAKAELELLRGEEPA